MRYRDFQILIGERLPDGYRVRVLASPAGEGEGFLAIAPDSSDMQAALRRMDAGDTDEEFLKGLGSLLFDKLFAGDIRDRYQQSLGEVGAEEGLRLRLRIEPPEISVLPWEILYDQQRRFFLATSPEALVSRYIHTPARLAPLLVDLPLRILVVISSPTDLPHLNVEDEEERILKALKPLIRNKGVELDVLRVATPQAIRAKLRDKDYHVFHFIGHGDFVEGEGYLALVEAVDGNSHMMDAEDFSTFFLGYRHLRLIILNACRSAETGGEHAFVGMAPHLVGRGIPAVIAMRYPIYDDTARLFSEEFYGSLVKGYPVDTAISDARRAILQMKGRGQLDFAVPVLFMRAEDGVIIEFHSEKRERIIEGTQDALHTISNLFERYSLKDGSLAVGELVGNLSELVELNRHLLEWIELHDMLHELEVGLTFIYDEVRRKQPAEMDTPSIKAHWRLWKDNAFVKMVTFASSIRHIGDAYCEDDEGQPQGVEWMVELATVQRRIDEDLEQLSLIPLRDHVNDLSEVVTKYMHFARRQLRTTAASLSTLSDELLVTIKP